jgi:hypothetical protein
VCGGWGVLRQAFFCARLSNGDERSAFGSDWHTSMRTGGAFPVARGARYTLRQAEGEMQGKLEGPKEEHLGLLLPSTVPKIQA